VVIFFKGHALIAGVSPSRVLQLVDPTSHVSWSHIELFICSKIHIEFF